MDEKGVIHGRFQMFHLKYLEYVLAAKMHCKKLYIGITHPDNTFTASSPNDKHGVTRRDNPMTFLERFEMIQGALEDFGVQREEYEIIPFPMNRPEYITQYAPADATYYMSICDAWGEERYQILKSLNLKVEVLWRRTEAERGITASEVRTCIEKGENWQQLVPRTVYEYVISHGIDQRIREYAKKGFATAEEL